MGNVTKDSRYWEQQWRMFNFSAYGSSCTSACTRHPENCDGYCFWNASDVLFYRDDSYLNSQEYWGRGNGWAISALVSAIEFGTADPHRPAYVAIFQQLA